MQTEPNTTSYVFNYDTMNNKSVESYFMKDSVVFLRVIVNGTVAEISRVTWGYYYDEKIFSEGTGGTIR